MQGTIGVKFAFCKGGENMTLEDRVARIEKEMADLKRQLGERLTEEEKRYLVNQVNSDINTIQEMQNLFSTDRYKEIPAIQKMGLIEERLLSVEKIIIVQNLLGLYKQHVFTNGEVAKLLEKIGCPYL